MHKIISRFIKNTKAAVSLISVFAFLGILLVGALSLEASSLYLKKVELQRVADIANLAAANTENPIVNHLPSAHAISTAKDVARINGFGSADIVTSVTTNTASKEELTTKIKTSSKTLFGTFLSGIGAVDVVASSTAMPVASSEGDCIRSLQGPVNIYGNAVVNGPSCLIASSTYLYACGQANITANAVEVNYSQLLEKAYICSTATIKPLLANFTFSKKSVNPLAADARILNIETRLKAMTSWPYATTIPAPLNPTTPAGTSYTYSGTTVTLPNTTAYGTLTVSNSVLNFSGTGSADPNCTNPTTISGNLVISGTSRLVFSSGCYAIGGYVTIAAGSNVSFETEPGADVTLAFKQYIKNDNATTNFGNMKISIRGDINNNFGGNLVFGNGPFYYGAGVINGTGLLHFGDGPFYFSGGTITNSTGTLEFGNGIFYLKGGSMANASTGTITFGNGPFYFYGGTVTNVSGTMIFGDGDFEFYGGSLALNSGSTTRFGVGNIDFYGGTAYINGANTTFGGDGDSVNGSSSVFFYGGSLTMATQHLVAKGTTFALWGGSYSLLGIGTMEMTAPTGATPNYGYQNILFYIHGGAFSLYQGAVTDTLSGTIYVPDTNVSIYGKQNIVLPEDGCFQIIGGVVDIYQNAAAAYKPCTAGTSTSKKIRITR